MQQRIGRIDRNGQKNTPLVFNLLCNVDNDIHTYYEIIFEKIRIINGISGICGIDVIRETNEDIQNQVLEEWVKSAQKAQKEYKNNFTALQNGYMKHLRRERNSLKSTGAPEDAIFAEIRRAEGYSDEEVLEKMKHILFTVPNEELKSIREDAHCLGKEEIAKKIFTETFKPGDSVRKKMIEHIRSVLSPFLQKGFLKYVDETDTFVLDISEIKIPFLQYVIKEQLFDYFVILEDPDIEKGQIDMYYDETQIAFGTAVYKEIRSTEAETGKLLNEFEENIGEPFDAMFVALNPLDNVLQQCI
jgi:hypothetical protein